MKLPLIRPGYQPKHKRGQVPRQREDDSALRAVEEQEIREEQGLTDLLDLPGQRPPFATDEPADSPQSRM
jgi:hypothetical protein